MQSNINLILPKGWQELDDKQLRFVFHLLASDHTAAQIKVLCLLKWGKIRIMHRKGAVFIVKHNGQQFPLSALQLTEASQSLSWLDDIPQFPVRLSRIGRHHPIRADLQTLPFGDFLILDNFYQGYLQTTNPELVREMATILYQSHKIRLDKGEVIAVFYWFTSVKQMFARVFHHFFRSVSGQDGMTAMPSHQQLREAVDTQIRALTGGDITKEKDVLNMDCWRALTELDAKARDYEEMKKSSKS